MKIESLVDIARRHIQLWIIKGEYHPGQKLTEEEISSRLNISRMPIREAFKALEIEGLIVRKPRRGVFVSRMTKKDVWEVYTLKAHLYEMATDLALDLMTDDRLNSLEKIVSDMQKCVSKNPADLLGYQDHHWRFHERIMTVANNVRLKKITASLHHQVTRFSYLSLQDRTHLDSSVRYHRLIFQALKEKEKARACELMKTHVLMALDVVLDKMASDHPGVEVLPDVAPSKMPAAG